MKVGAYLSVLCIVLLVDFSSIALTQQNADLDMLKQQLTVVQRLQLDHTPTPKWMRIAP